MTLLRFLQTMTGRSEAMAKIRRKKQSFFVALTTARIQQVVPILPAVTVGVDAIELRADLLVDPQSPDGFPTPDDLVEQIALLRASSTLPIIFTLRTESQGGKFPDDDARRALSLYRVALRMGVDFVDLELTSAPEVKAFVLSHRKMCTIIASHHDPQGQLSWAYHGEDWKPFFDAAREYGDIVKLVGVAATPDDNDDVKAFKRWAAAEYSNLPFIAMNMGEAGKMSRVSNGFMTPVSHPLLPAKAAPGQLSAAEIRTVLGIIGEIVPKKFFLFGKPISQSRSPPLHNTLFGLTGLPHEYGLFETDHAEDIVPIIRSPNFGGGSVTIPLKLDVMPLIDTINPAAQTIGAVNTIVPTQDAAGKTILTGHNTDWQGMVLALRNAGAYGNTGILTEAGMVIGGGGTARAAIFALKNMGYNPIYLVGRNKAKLGALTHSFSRDYNIILLSSVEEVTQISAEKQPVVAIGTIPGDTPIDSAMREILCSIFQVGATAASTAGVTAGNARKVLLEMAYKPAVTALMELASNCGWRTVPGLEALVGQGIHQFKLWTDIMPLYQICRDAVMGKPVSQ